MKTLPTAHGALALPAFLPDGTRGVVKTIDTRDLAESGIQALMVNSLHLATHPGTGVLSGLGGIHRFMGWDVPVASDSGGFQVFSLVSGSSSLGGVSRHGFSYRLDKGQAKRRLTPDKCVRSQLQIGADILFCLDYCTHPDADTHEQRRSVEYTVAWAKACKDEFDRWLDQTGAGAVRPLLFAVVQGGGDPDLRRACAEQLIEMGFDGYGYGGWPIGDDGRLIDMVGHVSALVPEAAPLHALGVGKPENIVAAYRLGYSLFDCVLPTRDARHRRLYAFTGPPDELDLDGAAFYEHVYMQDARHVRDGRPIGETCDCLCCRRFSRAYLHHLFRVDDPLALRLATIHNLRFYARLMARLRAPGAAGPAV